MAGSCAVAGRGGFRWPAGGGGDEHGSGADAARRRAVGADVPGTAV